MSHNKLSENGKAKMSISMKSMTIETVKNKLVMRKATNNLNMSVLSMSLDCDGDHKTDFFHLAATQQPMKTRYERIDAIINVTLAAVVMENE